MIEVLAHAPFRKWGIGGDVYNPIEFLRHHIESLRIGMWHSLRHGFPNIIWAVGNPSDPRFTPTGQQPLHLRLWFQRAADNDVHELIHRLENLAAPLTE